MLVLVTTQDIFAPVSRKHAPLGGASILKARWLFKLSVLVLSAISWVENKWLKVEIRTLLRLSYHAYSKKLTLKCQFTVNFYFAHVWHSQVLWYICILLTFDMSKICYELSLVYILVLFWMNFVVGYLQQLSWIMQSWYCVTQIKMFYGGGGM